MAIPFQHIESQLSEAVLLRAEQLVDAGALRSLREPERNLWVGQLRDGPSAVEVELKVTASRVMGATCDCAAFEPGKWCAHVAATAMILRRTMQERQAKGSRKQASKNKPAKLTTTLILDEVAPEELLEFVREYARRHRPFALALKARFTGQVEALEGKDKFVQLLESTIKLAQRPDRSLSKRSTQRVARVVGQLHQQSDDALEEGHFLMVFHVQAAILEKISPLLAVVPIGDQRLRRLLAATFDRLERLQALAPPALQDRMRAFAARHVDRLVYRSHRLDLRWLPLVSGAHPGPEGLEALSEAKDRLLLAYRREDREPSRVRQAYYQVLRRLEQHERAFEWVAQHPHDRPLLRHALQDTLEGGETELAARLITEVFRTGSEDELPDWLFQLLIGQGEALGPLPAWADLLERRILQQPQADLLQPLRLAAGPSWPELAERLSQALDQRSSSRRAVHVRAHLLVTLGRRQDLLRLLRREGSLDLLMRFDEHLLPECRHGLLDAYRQILGDYVREHLGPKSSQKIREVLEHLRLLGQKALSQELAESFRATYPERHTLMEELAQFQ